MVEDVIQTLKADVEEAKEAREKAQELIDLGKEAGIDVSEQEARLRTLSDKIDRLEQAIEERE